MVVVDMTYLTSDYRLINCVISLIDWQIGENKIHCEFKHKEDDKLMIKGWFIYLSPYPSSFPYIAFLKL